MTIKRIVLISILCFGKSFLLSAQKPLTAAEKKLESKAEDLLGNEDYNAALICYLKLDSIQPDNLEYKYKTGICYLNSRSNKIKSFPYFTAVLKDYKPDEYNKFIDFEIYFYMGRVLHLNSKFDEAIGFFERYKTFVKKDDPRYHEANRRIEICKYAKQMVLKTSYTNIVNLGPKINSPFPEYSPVITADESSIIFTSRREGSTGGKLTDNGMYFEDIYTSQHVQGEWSDAVAIDTSINTSGHEASVSVSVDGDQLIIYKDDKGEGNLYSCILSGTQWLKPVKLSSNVNSKYWEPSASLSSDRTLLYFVSNRLGSGRGRDIFVSNLMPDGSWGIPKNLGNKINTEYDEDAPFIHPSGKTLYFSSKGHNSMGGFDIFKSNIDDYGEWSEPVNLGYPINTTDDDVFFVLSADGKHGYFSSDREGGYGDEDIYRVDFIESKEQPVVVLKGNILHLGDSLSSIGARITVSEQSSGDLIGYYKPNSKTGQFLVILPIGKNFDVLIEENGYITHEEVLAVESQKKYLEITKRFALSKESNPPVIAEGDKPGDKAREINIDVQNASPGDRIVLHNIVYDFNKATLLPESKRELNVLVKTLKDNPGLVIEISSHTDSKGNPQYNMKLSMERGANVVDYILKKGIKIDQIVSKGYGETQPVANNTNPDGSDNPEGRQKNRRTEFKVLRVK